MFVHLHAGHGGVVHVVVAVVVVDGPDFAGVGFIGIDVSHPAEDVGEENSVSSFAVLAGVDGTEQSEFWIGAEVSRFLSGGRFAEVGVLVPLFFPQCIQSSSTSVLFSSRRMARWLR